MSGSGSDQCSDSAQCVNQHAACANNLCELVPGSGPSTCGSDSACSSSATHQGCSNGQCVALQGSGTDSCNFYNLCSSGSHAACTGSICAIVNGPGPDTCWSDSQCDGSPITPPPVSGDCTYTGCPGGQMCTVDCSSGISQQGCSYACNTCSTTVCDVPKHPRQIGSSPDGCPFVICINPDSWDPVYLCAYPDTVDPASITTAARKDLISFRAKKGAFYLATPSGQGSVSYQCVAIADVQADTVQPEDARNGLISFKTKSESAYMPLKAACGKDA